jgi:hypothetical protein
VGCLAAEHSIGLEAGCDGLHMNWAAAITRMCLHDQLMCTCADDAGCEVAMSRGSTYTEAIKP